MSGQEELQGLEVFSLFQALRVAPSPLLGSGMAVSGWEHVASQLKDPRACLPFQDWIPLPWTYHLSCETLWQASS